MVHLFRGRGFPRPRPPLLGPRHLRPHGYEPDFIPPFGLPRARPNMITRPPLRTRPLPPPPPRMIHPSLPPRPRLPPPHIPIREIPFPPVHPPAFHPPVPPRPPLRGLMRPQLPLRGRGLFPKRGVSVKRLVSSDGSRVKKNLKRKEKTEGAFFCETCDRGWKTEEKLQEHVAQHQVCGRDGCKFTADPKVVLKHIQIQHDTGLYNRINLEDATKWIAERKSRYPTKENKERKEAQLNEMVKRGERIPTQEKRFQNNHTRGSWRDRRNRVRENSNQSQGVLKKENYKPVKLRKQCQSNQWRDPDAWRGDLPQFPGTAAFPPEEETPKKDAKEIAKENFSDDEEWTESGKIENSVIHKPIVSNILTSLVANYGSDMSDEDEENIIIQPKVETHIPVLHDEEEQAKNKMSVNFQGNEEKEFPCKLEKSKDAHGIDSDSGPEEIAIEHEDKSNIPVLKGKEVKEEIIREEKAFGIERSKEDGSQTRPKTSYVKTPMKRHQLSLLEKLLKNEIIHERNVILQCVRYIVKSNFLGCGNLPQNISKDLSSDS